MTFVMRSVDYPWLTAVNGEWQAELEGVPDGERARRLMLLAELRAGRIMLCGTYSVRDERTPAEPWKQTQEEGR